jgi:hypothetical protein
MSLEKLTLQKSDKEQAGIPQVHRRYTQRKGDVSGSIGHGTAQLAPIPEEGVERIANNARVSSGISWGFSEIYSFSLGPTMF